MDYPGILNIVLSIDLNSLLWDCIGLKLGHLLWEGGGELSILTVSAPSVPLSFLSLTSSLSSKVEARGGEGGLTGLRSCSLARGPWLWQALAWRVLHAVTTLCCFLLPGCPVSWSLTTPPWPLVWPHTHSIGCPLGGTPLWPPKPVAAFCAHAVYVLVLIAPCSLLEPLPHPQGLSH